MKKLQKEIRRPFLWLLIGILIICMLLFNVAMRLYQNQVAREDINEATDTLASLLQQNAPEGGVTSENADWVLSFLSAELTKSGFMSSIQLLMFNEAGALIYPTTLSGRLGTEVLEKRIDRMNDSRTHSIMLRGERYFARELLTTGKGETVLLITRAGGTNAYIRTVNLYFLIILAAGIAVSILVSGAIASRIAKPVTALCTRARAIGRGEFHTAGTAQKSDIGELFSLQESIEQMGAQLSAYDNAQRTFLQNASHELKTPLMSIQGYAEGILNGVMPDNKKAAEVIMQESRRLNALVEELLTLSRIETNGAKELTPLPLNEALKEYAQRLSMASAREGRKLTLLLPDADHAILGDDALLSQAVNNIVLNCLRYAKTEVRLELFTRKEDAVIKISDDGAGIAPEDLPHLFERFYKGKGGKFGLGLAIAQSAVAAMGGRIVAYNQETGAAFELLLPVL